MLRLASQAAGGWTHDPCQEAEAMKKALLVVAVGLGVWVGLAAPRGIAAAPSCTPNQPHQARLTVKRLHIWNRPIGTGYAARSKGPIWDPDFTARTGQGRSSVIQAHDVTPVPGYGKHGPFYRLPSMRRGDLATITRCGVRYTYKFVRSFHRLAVPNEGGEPQSGAV